MDDLLDIGPVGLEQRVRIPGVLDEAQIRLEEPRAGSVDSHAGDQQRLIVREPALAGLDRFQLCERIIDDLRVARRLGRIEALC